jgi:hypothetical protein
MNKMIRIAGLAAVCAIAMQMTGCANLKMSTPSASLENTATLRSANMTPVNVGTFTATGAAMGSKDKSISIRGGNSVESPVGPSFTEYLRETVKVEMAAAGLLDEKSSTVITGTMIDSDLESGNGSGYLVARFVVTRDGTVRFDRELKTTTTWESSFIGAVAIPAAAHGYESLYRMMATKLINDAEFRKAVAK